MTKASELYGRPWSEREYIIVLHHYFKYRDRPHHINSPFVLDLSKLMGRTPSSILMRMENYASIDPAVNDSKAGLDHVTALCCKVFNDWCYKEDSLKDCADAFCRDSKHENVPTLFEPDPIKVPRAFGKYELLDLLGQGQFGVVYSCLNPENNKLYAIKFIRMDIINSPEHYNRFLREIKTLKTINHSNIINVHEDNLDSERNYPAFVMDLCGESLTSYLWRESKIKPGLRPVLSNQESCKILRFIMEATEALHNHEQRLIHRDINPNNILKTFDGSWLLADFSLSKFLEPAPSSLAFVTASHQGWGTGWYAAPEQYIDFANADEKTDIQAIGKLIWELFTIETPPPRPGRDRHGLSEKLASVYFKATDYDAHKRYGTIAELREDFEDAIVNLDK